LAEVRLARFADSARQRIRPECLVVCAAVVVTREAEAARRPEDQQGGGKRQRAGPTYGLGTEPRVMAVAKEERRVEGRQIRPVLKVLPLECRPRRVHDERGE